MTITLDLPAEWEAPLQAAARLQGKDVTAFVTDGIRQQLRSDVLPESEAELLLRLQTLFPPEQTREFRALRERSDAGTLTEADRERFLVLIEERELQNAKRLRIIGKLAQLRGVSFRDMMARLEIRPE